MGELLYRHVLVTASDFSLDDLCDQLSLSCPQSGAIVSFLGRVRPTGQKGQSIHGLWLEHYPGMTESSIEGRIEQAQRRWSLEGLSVVHRVGRLDVGEQIVAVLVAARHRREAFEACQYLMDYLKIEAPFWKKELGPDGQWVEANDSDVQRIEHWE